MRHLLIDFTGNNCTKCPLYKSTCHFEDLCDNYCNITNRKEEKIIACLFCDNYVCHPKEEHDCKNLSKLFSCAGSVEDLYSRCPKTMDKETMSLLLLKSLHAEFMKYDTLKNALNSIEDEDCFVSMSFEKYGDYKTINLLKSDILNSFIRCQELSVKVYKLNN